MTDEQYKQLSGTITELTDNTGVGKGAIREMANGMALAGVTSGEATTGIVELSSQLSYLKSGSNDLTEQLGTMFSKSIGSGKLMEKQLVKFGINLDEVSARAGMTTEELKATFEQMTPDERANFLNKYMIDSKDAEFANKELAGSFDALKDKASNNLSGIASTVGETFLPILIPAFEKVGAFLTQVKDGFNSLPKPVKDVVGGIILFVGGFLTIALAIGSIMGPIGTFISFMGKLKLVTIAQTVAQWAYNAAQAAFNFIMSANPIVLVVIAIVALIAIFVLLYNKNETVRNAINGLWEVLKGVGQFIVDGLINSWNWLKDTLTNLFNMIINNPFVKFAITLFTLSNPILFIITHLDLLKATFDKVKNFVMAAIGVILSYLNNFKQTMINVKNSVMELVFKVINRFNNL
jgi:phage-related minor tail protein